MSYSNTSFRLRGLVKELLHNKLSSDPKELNDYDRFSSYGKVVKELQALIPPRILLTYLLTRSCVIDCQVINCPTWVYFILVGSHCSDPKGQDLYVASKKSE